MRLRAVQLGSEILTESPPAWLRSQRLGLVANQASVTSAFEHVSAAIRRAGGRLVRLFAPQHGFCGEKQANMIESDDAWDREGGIPIYSLYGRIREPSREVLDGLDVLLIDLQDVGTRVYTYGTTMGLCLEAASRLGVKVVVLDRPNPINGSAVEGNLLRGECRSFVGRYPIPMRHGLTMGELAHFIVNHCGVPCDLEVIPMAGWRRGAFFPDTGLPWVPPSPNMPSWETALLYPGMVLLEGTNVSEGRGTTLPFHLFGAPFLDQRKMGEYLGDLALEGVVFRPVCFEPVFDKWTGEVCYGFQIHITDRERVRPYHLGLALIRGLLDIHGDPFRLLPPPYEYEYEKLPMDILIGDEGVRRQVEGKESMGAIEVQWQGEIEAYRRVRQDCLLYED